MLPLICLIGGPAQAERIVVDASGSGDFTTIQDAVDAANPEDHIVVLAGTYGSVQLTSWAGPILGIDGPELTWIDTSDANAVDNAAVGRLTIIGFTIAGGSAGGVYARDQPLRLERVHLQDTTDAVYATGAAQLSADGVSTNGVRYGFRLTGGAQTITNYSGVDASSWHISTQGTLDASQFITSHGPGITCTGSGAVTLDYGMLYEYGSTPYLSTCATTGSLLLGFDPEFSDFSDDGDPGNDDLSLLSSSLAVDRGDSACMEGDGTTCDLGAYGGLIGADEDADADGMPDWWEDQYGLDTSVDDGDADSDGDGLEDLGEYLWDTDPTNSDSDEDGLDDLSELALEFDPNLPDQEPTAAIDLADNVVFLGESLLLDGSGSSDPADQALSYQWSVLSAPGGTTLSDLGTDASVTFTPDVAGAWSIQLEVDDGTWTDSVSLTVQVVAGRDLLIPDDYATFAELQPLLQDGMTVTFGEGSFNVDIDLDKDVVIRGQGELTALRGQISIHDSAAELRDFNLTGTASPTITITNSPLVELYDIRMELNSYSGVNASDANVVGHGLVIDDAATGWSHFSPGTSTVRRSTIQGNYALYGGGGTLDAEGLFLDGARGIYSTAANVRADHVSIITTDRGLYLNNGASELTHIYVHGGNYASSCASSGRHDLSYLFYWNTILDSSCDTYWAIQDPVGLNLDGSLGEASLAFGAGDFRERDSAGERPDIGAWDGEWALGTDHGLSDPYADEDDDGVSALGELILGTLDSAPDSDGDGVGDMDELAAFSDPSDPTDHMPDLELSPVRTGIGESVEISISVGSDPDGDSCSFSWDDGASGSSRTVSTSEAGRFDYAFTLVCGDGQLQDVLVVLVEEEITISSASELEAALSALEDHHALILDPGDYSTDVDLRGGMARVQGSGSDTVVVGSVELDTDASALSDLRVRGTVAAAAGSLRRVVIDEDLLMGDSWGRNLLVWGALEAPGRAHLSNLTVVGDAAGPVSDVRSVAGLLELEFGQATSSYLVGATRDDFALFGDADSSMMIPWPQSSLWNAGSPATTYIDLDGTREDIGYTGGPESAISDTDLDTITDIWEQWYGVDDPDDDPDEDTLSNLEEWELGTDPTLWDTDGDRIPDGLDPDPRSAAGVGLSAALMASNIFPELGETVTLDARHSMDISGQPLSFGWELEAPDGSSAELTIDGGTARFAPDTRGDYSVVLTATAFDGLIVYASKSIYLGSTVLAQRGEYDTLQSLVDGLDAGTTVELEEGTHDGPLRLTRDLRIRQVSGATGASIEGTDVPAVMVLAGAHLRLEQVTLRGEDGAAALWVEGASAELHRTRLLGGDYALAAIEAEVEGVSCVITGAGQLVVGNVSELGFRNCVIGYGELSGVTPIVLSNSSFRASQSVFVGDDNATMFSNANSTVSLVRSAVNTERVIQTGVNLSADVIVVEPDFLVPPTETSDSKADYRLATGSALQDAGGTVELDPDGSANDLGPHGGPLADWLDVDNDRDGFNNLEGDCDDWDPDVVPDWLSGECPDTNACVGCDGGAGSGSSALGLLALMLLRRRRRETA